VSPSAEPKQDDCVDAVLANASSGEGVSDLKSFRLLSTAGVPAEFATSLFTSWVQALMATHLSSTQAGSGGTSEGTQTFSFGDQSADHLVLEVSSHGDWNLRSSAGIDERVIQNVVDQAMQLTSASDLGGDIVYRTTLQAKDFEISPASMLHFVRLLGDQVPITGPRRLSDRVLLDFTIATPPSAGPLLFAPATEITVTTIVPGPIAGSFSRKIAAGTIEVVAAICSFATGRSIETSLVTFPANEEIAAEARALRFDSSILGLARDGVSLDVFGEFMALGGPDGFLRVRGALLNYQAALRQSSPDVATMLLVGALEALIVPRQPWRTEKATKRFIDAIEELCPEVADAVVNHLNVESAFGYRRKGGARARRKQLLDQIYTLRSDPSHNGLGLSGVGMFPFRGDSMDMRVALLSELARGALLRFLQAPRSSLIGNPKFDEIVRA